MIAPIRSSQQEPPSTGLQRARRAVAAMLLDAQGERFDRPPLLAGWKAWLLLAWIMVALAAYGAAMLGWL